jgi:hypothetical protein
MIINTYESIEDSSGATFSSDPNLYSNNSLNKMFCAQLNPVTIINYTSTLLRILHLKFFIKEFYFDNSLDVLESYLFKHDK